jgi:small subunit ribosomal protein S9
MKENTKISVPHALNARGGRKSAHANVRFSQDNTILVNGKEINAYFNNIYFVMIATTPLKLTNQTNRGLIIMVKGSGINGQASAIRNALAKLLAAENPEFKSLLSPFFTRDSRSVESKKAGQPKARKRAPRNKR